MQPGPGGPGDKARRLDARNLFFVVCREAFRDGRVDEADNRVLEYFRQRLGLEPEISKQVALAAKKRAALRGVEEGARLDGERVFFTAARHALVDGSASPEERALLDLVREAFRIPEARARRLVETAGEVALEVSRPGPPRAGPGVMGAGVPRTVDMPKVDDDPPARPTPSAPAAPHPPADVATLEVEAGPSSPEIEGAALGDPEPGSEEGGPPAEPSPRASGKARDPDAFSEERSARVAGPPESWVGLRPFTLAFEVWQAHFGLWLQLAVISGVAAVVPFLGLLTGPLTTLLVLGGARDALDPDDSMELLEVWRRWRPRLRDFLVTGGLLVALLLSVAVGWVVFSGVALAVGRALGEPDGGWIYVGVAATTGLGGLVVWFHNVLFSMHEAVLGVTKGLDAIRSGKALVARRPGTVLGTMALLGTTCGLGLLATLVAAHPLELAVGIPVRAAAGEGSWLVPLALAPVYYMREVVGQLVGIWGFHTWSYLYLREWALAQRDAGGAGGAA